MQGTSTVKAGGAFQSRFSSAYWWALLLQRPFSHAKQCLRPSEGFARAGFSLRFVDDQEPEISQDALSLIAAMAAQSVLLPSRRPILVQTSNIGSETYLRGVTKSSLSFSIIEDGANPV